MLGHGHTWRHQHKLQEKTEKVMRRIAELDFWVCVFLLPSSLSFRAEQGRSLIMDLVAGSYLFKRTPLSSAKHTENMPELLAGRWESAGVLSWWVWPCHSKYTVFLLFYFFNLVPLTVAFRRDCRHTPLHDRKSSGKSGSTAPIHLRGVRKHSR